MSSPDFLPNFKSMNWTWQMRAGNDRLLSRLAILEAAWFAVNPAFQWFDREVIWTQIFGDILPILMFIFWMLWDFGDDLQVEEIYNMAVLRTFKTQFELLNHNTVIWKVVISFHKGLGLHCFLLIINNCPTFAITLKMKSQEKQL